MTTYAVQMDTADQAQFLADRQGNSFRLTAEGTVVTFDDAARDWFASRPEEDDGHIDTDGNLWLGGDPYPVQTQDN